jgi:hypothetical protein
MLDGSFAMLRRNITEAGYRTILEHLTKRGYSQGHQPFVFYCQ